MTPLYELFGRTLLSRRGEAPTQHVLDNKSTIGLYFTASSCRPCQLFTPVLATVYRNMALATYRHLSMKDDMEVVVIAMDRDELAFRDTLLQTPFWALPFHRRDEAQALWKKYDVKTIPSLIFVNQHGEQIERDGRHLVERHFTDLRVIWEELKQRQRDAEPMP